MLYLVTWQIDIEADTPQEAARKALLIQRKHDSIATVFDVTDEAGQTSTFDLNPEWS
jgi:hypothetical protein